MHPQFKCIDLCNTISWEKVMWKLFLRLRVNFHIKKSQPKLDDIMLLYVQGHRMREWEQGVLIALKFEFDLTVWKYLFFI
jgi:hypothetical protein